VPRRTEALPGDNEEREVSSVGQALRMVDHKISWRCDRPRRDGRASAITVPAEAAMGGRCLVTRKYTKPPATALTILRRRVRQPIRKGRATRFQGGRSAIGPATTITTRDVALAAGHEPARGCRW